MTMMRYKFRSVAQTLYQRLGCCSLAFCFTTKNKEAPVANGGQLRNLGKPHNHRPHHRIMPTPRRLTPELRQ
jgi:hypothetical protein